MKLKWSQFYKHFSDLSENLKCIGIKIVMCNVFSKVVFYF